jgi:hypothetical protein
MKTIIKSSLALFFVFIFIFSFFFTEKSRAQIIDCRTYEGQLRCPDGHLVMRCFDGGEYCRVSNQGLC